jgi:hypothetical protein
MSMRTIVEFNHDYIHQIREKPEEFIRWLELGLNSGNDERYWEELRRFGVVKAIMVHHSDERKVVTKFKEIAL